ncbi:MAG: LUD domain-containing protein [Bacillota bacterium]|jgi:Uncharacterized conserved protein
MANGVRDARREAFLNRVAARLGKPRGRRVMRPDFGPLPSQAEEQLTTPAARAAAFCRALEALKGRPQRAADLSELDDAVRAIVRRHGVRQAVLWDAAHPALERVEAALCASGVTVRRWPDGGTVFAEACELGVVVAEMAVAQTGSVVLPARGGQGRSVSLLPPVLLVLVDEERIVGTLTDALRAIGRRARGGDLPACVNLVTGPSRSADIEMDLSVGVHGPGAVYAVVVGALGSSRAR